MSVCIQVRIYQFTLDNTGQFYNKILIGRPDVETTKQQFKPPDESKSVVSILKAEKTNVTAVTEMAEGSVKKHVQTNDTDINRDGSATKEFEIKLLQIRQEILDEIKKGSYKMDIAPSDLVDFGGQRSFDLTHQLFIQYKGTFVLMVDGRFNLNEELDEYKPTKMTSGCKFQFFMNNCQKSFINSQHVSNALPSQLDLNCSTE